MIELAFRDSLLVLITVRSTLSRKWRLRPGLGFDGLFESYAAIPDTSDELPREAGHQFPYVLAMVDEDRCRIRRHHARGIGQSTQTGTLHASGLFRFFILRELARGKHRSDFAIHDRRRRRSQ